VEVAGQAAQNGAADEAQDAGDHGQKHGVVHRRHHLVEHGAAGRHRVAEIALDQAAQPFQVLDRPGLIEAIGLLQGFDDLGRRIGRGHGVQRIAGRNMDQQKADEADAQRDRNGVQKTFDQIGEHPTNLRVA